MARREDAAVSFSFNSDVIITCQVCGVGNEECLSMCVYVYGEGSSLLANDPPAPLHTHTHTFVMPSFSRLAGQGGCRSVGRPIRFLALF